MLPVGPAIVMLTDPPMTRAAGLVYRTPDGIGWVEPSFWDGDPPTVPAWHEFAGQLQDTPLGAVLYGEQTIVLLDADLVKGTDEDDRVTREIIEALSDRLRAAGTSFAEQRIALAPQLPVSG